MNPEQQQQYVISGKIGAGGMGTVYLATDTALQRPVAIKELKRLGDNGQDAIEDRFQQEALALARLNHSNITHLYAFLPKGDTYWMVMEYVPGKTLEEWLHYRGSMNSSLAVSIILQMLCGLEHAHKKGIIHRDLKPSNVMVSEDGEVKIMDFGIARIRDSQRITRHGKSVGTLAYMAPEQIKGEEGDERTDLYAAGNILYELLSGHTPFEAETDYHLMKLKLEEAPRNLLSQNVVLPSGLDKVIQKALDKNPERRYQTVAELTRALEQSMKGLLLAPEVLNPTLSNLQKEEEFVQAIKENPFQKLSGMLKTLPGMATADRLSGGLKRIKFNTANKSLWLLAASVFVCILLLLWQFSSDNDADPLVRTQDSPVIISSPDLADGRREQPGIIENQILQNNRPPDNAERDAEEESKREDGSLSSIKDPNKSRDKLPAAPKQDKLPRESDSKLNNTDNSTVPRSLSASTGPVDVPSGLAIRVILDETLSSENLDKDGSQVRLHSDENVMVSGKIIIRKGALVTGKIVDVRTSNSKKEPMVGFIIQKVQAADGSMLKLRSERLRTESKAKGQPVYIQAGQSFKAETKGGRVN